MLANYKLPHPSYASKKLKPLKVCNNNKMIGHIFKNKWSISIRLFEANKYCFKCYISTDISRLD